MLFLYGSAIAFVVTSVGFINAKNPIVNNINIEVDKKDCDGIIFLRFNWIYSQTDYVAMNKLHMYGTAVRFK